MSRRLALIMVALGVLVGAAGTAIAAFVSSTSTGVNTFTTRAVASKPVISGVRITSDPSCAAASPAETVRQNGTFYACVNSVTDPAGIASVTADLTNVNGDNAVPLNTSGGPFSGYTYRSAAQTAGAPLETGTTGAWSIKATNTNGDRSTLSGQSFNIRSYDGMLRGEFGAPAFTNVAHYYRFGEATTTAQNASPSSTTPTVTYNGTPTRQVDGAIVGSADKAVRLNGATDYLSHNRLAAIASDYSLEIWVKGSATTGAGPGTLWSDSAGLIDAGNAASNNDFGLALDATGRLVAGCGNAAASTIRSNPGAISDGNWHHVVFTRVRTTGAIRLYLDGVNVANATTCNTTAHTGSTTIWYGRSHESNLYLTGADLDQAVLYSRAITAAEVLDHYNLGAAIQ